ncbi:hypothetical protein NA57DRAFT_80732 [Rhizodiscina lignyota]|uniref:Xaa-Pro aminopeptidase n=1 Tax=Rhizodiscina lignyota TaxID=1504668 RepID=A0A9P4I3D5_9PEZI|nr:hypothetical protein NA57DRAFT_80732 [Rhizodiscina lignyota]
MKEAPNTEEAPLLKEKYPAKAHARKVAEWIKQNGGGGKGVIYLEGQKDKLIEDNDQQVPFRQRRYFFYLTGCELPDCYYAYNIEQDKSTLFIPPIDADEVIWSGLPLTTEEAMEKFDIDTCLPGTSLNQYLTNKAHSTLPIYCLSGDSQVSSHVTFLEFSTTNFSLLRSALDFARTTKDEYEIAMLRHANIVTNQAHAAVQRAARAAKNERELDAVFRSHCMVCGCGEMAYHPIMASGTSASTLHYVHNNADLDESGNGYKGGMPLNMLVDAGCEYRCYCADVTRTFPINGTFTKESREIYDLVLDMQKTCMGMLKAGAVWDDIHAHSHKIAIDGLLKLGILKGDKDEIFKSRTSTAFYPHGLGHYLGMDTHDVGGFANYKDTDIMFRYLRVRGKVPAGAVITVEPGVYFCRFMIEPYLKNDTHSKFIDADVLERYWQVGGVRIEDDVVVTENGCDNLTTAVKEPEEVEKAVKA